MKSRVQRNLTGFGTNRGDIAFRRRYKNENRQCQVTLASSVFSMTIDEFLDEWLNGFNLICDDVSPPCGHTDYLLSEQSSRCLTNASDGPSKDHAADSGCSCFVACDELLEVEELMGDPNTASH